jgi:hypothetical protein
MAAAARGDLAERMVDAACALACGVRDEDADAIAEFLAGYTAREKDALLVVLAAMVPVDTATKADLLAWVTFDEHGQPFDGTPPALARRRPARDDGDGQDEPRLPARERNLRTFAELRTQGLGAEEAAVRMGKDRRTGWRYAQTLREREQAAAAEQNRAVLEQALREHAEDKRHAAA